MAKKQSMRSALSERLGALLRLARVMVTSSAMSPLRGSTVVCSYPYMMKNCLHSSSAAAWGAVR